MYVCVCVCVYNIIQVDIGSSPNELLYYLQIALLCRHHQGSLSILKQGERKGTETVIMILRHHTKRTKHLQMLIVLNLLFKIYGKIA